MKPGHHPIKLIKNLDLQDIKYIMQRPKPSHKNDVGTPFTLRERDVTASMVFRIFVSETSPWSQVQRGKL